MRLVRVVKKVKQRHKASTDLLRLLDEFRRMVNVCIAIGIEENVSSLKTLSLKSYHRLSRDILATIGSARSALPRVSSQLSEGCEEESSDKVSAC